MIMNEMMTIKTDLNYHGDGLKMFNLVLGWML